jgi:hypothetical protein
MFLFHAVGVPWRTPGPPRGQDYVIVTKSVDVIGPCRTATKAFCEKQRPQRFRDGGVEQPKSLTSGI